MNQLKNRLFWIKFPYWLGIGADALWAVGLLFPSVFGALVGNADFNPDLQTRSILLIAGTLMTGWTCLLIWAVRKPIERRVVILLTAFPVVFGLFIVTLIGFINGNVFIVWALIKCIILMLSMVTSYNLAGKMEREIVEKHQ
ncbi:hypothetical protein HQ585_16950 [candidate division KSB1 bacterium]|nr:hypothetical protein [candidate division KSB1 bacterium]